MWSENTPISQYKDMSILLKKLYIHSFISSLSILHIFTSIFHHTFLCGLFSFWEIEVSHFIIEASSMFEEKKL